MEKNSSTKKVWRLGFTGGPCGGKTTAMLVAKQVLTDLGYYVIVIPEVPTELIQSGIRPFGNSLDLEAFEHLVIKMQLQKEQLYQEAAQMLPNEKVVILLDRAIHDIKIYVTEEQFKRVLKRASLSEEDALNRYDAVFHLVTAADGAEEFYTLANNSARTETPEEARTLDKRGISSWAGHPHFRVIDNSTNFEGKMQRLLNEILTVLGEKQ